MLEGPVASSIEKYATVGWEVGRNGFLPKKAHQHDAAFDLQAAERAYLRSGDRALINTEVKIQLPAGHAGLVLPRSGLAAKYGVTVLNAPGLIDPGYRGDIGVILLNTDPELTFEVMPGDRIAQLMIVKLADVVGGLCFIHKERGEGGFGSTG